MPETNLDNFLKEGTDDEAPNPLEEEVGTVGGEGSEEEGGEGEGVPSSAPAAEGSVPSWPPAPTGGNRTQVVDDPFPTLSDEQLNAFASQTNDALFRQALTARQQAKTLQDAARMAAAASQSAQLQTAFDLKAVQDFPALADASSELFKHTQAQISALVAGGYSAPDLNYRAAQAAAAALKVGPDQEKARLRRIERSSNFERPTKRPMQKPANPSDALGPVAKQMAANMGITSPEGLASWVEGLKQARTQVKGA